MDQAKLQSHEANPEITSQNHASRVFRQTDIARSAVLLPAPLAGYLLFCPPGRERALTASASDTRPQIHLSPVGSQVDFDDLRMRRTRLATSQIFSP